MFIFKRGCWEKAARYWFSVLLLHDCRAASCTQTHSLHQQEVHKHLRATDPATMPEQKFVNAPPATEIWENICHNCHSIVALFLHPSPICAEPKEETDRAFFRHIPLTKAAG